MKFYTCDRSSKSGKLRYFVSSKLSENMHETPEGFLICIGVPIARTGAMLYGEGETPLETNDDGVVKVDREADEVFRPETIASFEGKPVTITHPVDFVDPSNWKHLAKGVIQNVRRGEGDQKDDLIADLLIMDNVAINLIKNGLREVSCGYEADYTQTDEGRGVQTNIIGNHLALVEQGRAGSQYAIHDHKGKEDINMSTKKKTVKERIGEIFGKAQDEAMKVADEAGIGSSKPEEGAETGKSKGTDASAYDELVKMVQDLGTKIEGMAKGKDAEGSAAAGSGERVQKEKKQEDAEEGSSLESRLKALEAAVAKLLEREAKEDEVPVGDDDEEDMDDEESEDDDFEESTMTGDTASRVEILAPGMKLTKTAKIDALKSAYKTADGKKIIDSLSGGKPDFKNAAKVETLFIAASELMKQSRAGDLAKTKMRTNDFNSQMGQPSGFKTPEEINEANAKHYGKK